MNINLAPRKHRARLKVLYGKRLTGFDYFQEQLSTRTKKQTEQKPMAELPEILPVHAQNICQNPRSHCKNCPDIFSEICRFNNTLSFWRSNAYTGI